MALAIACGTKKDTPDVSGINADLRVQRFDRDLFAIDTASPGPGLDRLQTQYPVFLKDFLYNIMAFPPAEDSVVHSLKTFLHAYQPVYDTAQKVFGAKGLGEQEVQVRQALRFVKYYFPAYAAPKSLVAFIGPVEGYANVLTSSGFAVGLQLYLGATFSGYHSDYVREVYPEYQSRRFDRLYIPVNCMKNVVEDIYPDHSAGKPLVEQMVMLGKRLYIMDHLLPDLADTLKTGYTKDQLAGCYKHEGAIWDLFVSNDLLYSTDASLIRDYVTDGPGTPALGPGAPGLIAQFCGWQIVKKWMQAHPGITMTQLIARGDRDLFNETRYKPR